MLSVKAWLEKESLVYVAEAPNGEKASLLWDGTELQTVTENDNVQFPPINYAYYTYKFEKYYTDIKVVLHGNIVANKFVVYDGQIDGEYLIVDKLLRLCLYLGLSMVDYRTIVPSPTYFDYLLTLPHGLDGLLGRGRTKREQLIIRSTEEKSTENGKRMFCYYPHMVSIEKTEEPIIEKPRETPPKTPVEKPKKPRGRPTTKKVK